MKVKILLSLEESIVSKLDTMAGTKPRSTKVEELIEGKTERPMVSYNEENVAEIMKLVEAENPQHAVNMAVISFLSYLQKRQPRVIEEDTVVDYDR